MEFRSIITFLKVAELKNFSKAAEKLGYSQSAVTVQIKQLEKELGIRLFERVGKGAVLTESGQDFVFHANEILNTAKQAVDAVRGSEKKQSEREITGVLRVGSVESVSTALLPEILMEFHRICPQVEIVVHTSKRDVLIEEIRGNSLDLFLTLEKKADIRAGEENPAQRGDHFYPSREAPARNGEVCLGGRGAASAGGAGASALRADRTGGELPV